MEVKDGLSVAVCPRGEELGAGVLPDSLTFLCTDSLTLKKQEHPLSHCAIRSAPIMEPFISTLVSNITVMTVIKPCCDRAPYDTSSNGQQLAITHIPFRLH